jgi:hypothetical protein
MSRSNLAMIFLSAVAVSSCATQPAPHAGDLPGFWLGLLHGFTALFALIGSVFWDIRVYAFPNNGGWYDSGFVLGVAAFFGGSGGTAAH